MGRGMIHRSQVNATAAAGKPQLSTHVKDRVLRHQRASRPAHLRWHTSAWPVPLLACLSPSVIHPLASLRIPQPNMAMGQHEIKALMLIQALCGNALATTRLSISSRSNKFR